MAWSWCRFSPGGTACMVPGRKPTNSWRTAELRHIDKLLRDTRLVALIGPGASARPSIALAPAAAAAPHGACLVELSALREIPALLPHTVARRLELSEHARDSQRDALQSPATAACCSSSTRADTLSTPARSSPRRCSSMRLPWPPRRQPRATRRGRRDHLPGRHSGETGADGNSRHRPPFGVTARSARGSRDPHQQQMPSDCSARRARARGAGFTG